MKNDEKIGGKKQRKSLVYLDDWLRACDAINWSEINSDDIHWESGCHEIKIILRMKVWWKLTHGNTDKLTKKMIKTTGWYLMHLRKDVCLWTRTKIIHGN